jgi:NADH-quinone oxidoreductase subunit D
VCCAWCWRWTAKSSRRPIRTSGSCIAGTEKLAESKPFNQSIGYMDRLDYVSMMCNEHAYVLAIERCSGVTVPVRAQYIRVMFDEVTRILNHLMWLGSHALDIGAMTVFLLGLQGTRRPHGLLRGGIGHAHACHLLPPGRRLSRPAGLDAEVPVIEVAHAEERRSPECRRARDRCSISSMNSLARFPKAVDEYETLLTDNRIWKQRTVNIGVVTPERAMALGFTGAMLRGSGIAWDLRKKQPYEVYAQMDFDIPIGVNGDCYDRYLVRIEEMRQSTRIIKQCVDWLRKNPGPVMIDDARCGRRAVKR